MTAAGLPENGLMGGPCRVDEVGVLAPESLVLLIFDLDFGLSG